MEETIMGQFERIFGQWVVNNRWWLIAATIIVVLATASGGRYLSFNSDMRVFFSEENPQLQALEALEDTYTKNENVFFVIAPRDGNVFSRESLAAIEELTGAAWQIPYSSRVDSITNFQHTRAEEDDLIVEDLVLGAMSLSDAEIKEIKSIAINEPALVNRLISPTGHVSGINIDILKPGISEQEVPDITEYSRKLTEEFRLAHPDIDIHLMGGIIFDNAFKEVGMGDMATLVPFMFLVLLLVLGIIQRSISGVLSTSIIIAVSMVTAMGLAGWIGISLTSASTNAPIIILTLAVADSIHILATVFQNMRKGKPKHEAIAESLRVNLMPIFLTSITTAIGFLSMNFSDAPPFRDLGNIVAMGVMGAFFYSVLFLPALLSVIPVRVKARAGNNSSGCRSCEGLASFVIKRQKSLFWGMIAVMIALVAGTTQIDLDDDWIKYFDKKYEIRQAADFAQKNLTGFDIIEYSLESGESGGISNPAYLAKLDEFKSWYLAQDKVVHINTISDTLKRLNRNMHGDDESYYRIPESREMAAQYLLLYEMSLPFGLDLNNQINVDKSSTRFTVTIREATTTELREIDTRARGWLKTNAPESMFTYGSGISIMFAHISERNINNMLGASIGALVLISGILILALRSIKLGTLSLIPNLAPAFMAFGVWGMLVGQVGLGLSIVVSLTLGIVVDDTVHFMSKYLRARRELALSPEEAVRYSFDTVGNAIITSTLALVAGFMVLSMSGFKMNAEMGLMTAITITLALVLDFLFLPVLLIKVDSRRTEITDTIKEDDNEEVIDYTGGADTVAVTVDISAGRDA
jgi:predicted RND superfamily exporter protein